MAAFFDLEDEFFDEDRVVRFMFNHARPSQDEVTALLNTLSDLLDACTSSRPAAVIWDMSALTPEQLMGAPPAAREAVAAYVKKFKDILARKLPQHVLLTDNSALRQAANRIQQKMLGQVETLWLEDVDTAYDHCTEFLIQRRRLYEDEKHRRRPRPVQILGAEEVEKARRGARDAGSDDEGAAGAEGEPRAGGAREAKRADEEGASGSDVEPAPKPRKSKKAAPEEAEAKPRKSKKATAAEAPAKPKPKKHARAAVRSESPEIE